MFKAKPTTRQAVCSSYGNGLVRSNDMGQLFFNRLNKRDGTSRGILYCHGAGIPGNSLIAGQPFVGIADAGFVVLSTQRDQGGSIGVNTWGSDISRTQLTVDHDFLLASQGNGYSGGGAYFHRIALIGFSMGGCEAFNLAKTIGPDRIAGIVTVEGVADLSYARGLDIFHPAGAGGDWSGQFWATINTAYTNDAHNPRVGISPTDADWTNGIMQEHDPMFIASSIVDVPFLGYINRDDVVVGGHLVPSKTEILASKMRYSQVMAYPTGGHSAINVNPSELVHWLDNLDW